MYRSLFFVSLALLSVPAAAADTSGTAQAARDAANLNVLRDYYPKRALAAGEQGAVGFQVKLDAAGHPTECQVTRSSGYPLLDKETCDLITLRAVFKKPQNISGSQVSTHEGVVNWRLPDGTAAAGAAPQTMAQAALPEKKICKRITRIGSLVAAERVCMTPTEWKKHSDENKNEWEALQGRKGSTSGN